MSQCQADVRGEIVKILMELNRPATIVELAATCFARNVLDGTRRSVCEVVFHESAELVEQGVLGVHDTGGRLVILDVLTAMTLAVESSK